MPLGDKLYGLCTTRTTAYWVQQNEVAPVPVAAPLGAPPEGEHVPSEVRVGVVEMEAHAGVDDRTEQELGTVRVEVVEEQAGLP